MYNPTAMGRDLDCYSRQYAAQPYEKYQAAFRRREIMDILTRHSHSTLLEVGCGLESIFLHLDSFETMVVVEPAAVFYDKARSDAAKRKDKKITVINKTLEGAVDEIEGVDFDFVLVSSLLHEVPDPKAILRQVRSLCRPDTTVHINVPNANSFHRRLAVEMGLIKDVHEASAANIEFQQHAIFDLSALRRTAEEAGFRVEAAGAYAFKPFPHRQMQQMMDSQLLTEEMVEGFYKMGRHLPDWCSEIYVNVRKRDAPF